LPYTDPLLPEAMAQIFNFFFFVFFSGFFIFFSI
jgi:hypothetical protein